MRSSLLGMALSLGCTETPTEVYLRAISAANQDDRMAYHQQFTEESRALVQNLYDIIERSRGRLVHLRNDYALLAGEEVTGETIVGKRAELTVTNGRTESLVVLLDEHGQWRIDALSLDSLWAPLR